MPNLPLPNDITEWPSYRYWRQSDDERKRAWYIGFCLMMSSVQDRLTGLALQESGNLNWATTAFYYSTVHAGRLLCFAAMGDYPTSHSQLTLALDPAALVKDRIRFDWLFTFLKSLDGSFLAERVEKDNALAVVVLRACQDSSQVAGVDPDRIGRFGALLGSFKKLREDSNYEALLIAHERDHTRVTKSFETLAAAAEQVSVMAAELSIGMMTGLVNHHPMFDNLRPSLRRAQAWYMNDRLRMSLAGKFASSANCIRELERLCWLGRIDLAASSNDGDDLVTFLQPIMLEAFSGKKQLMDVWDKKIQRLVSGSTAAQSEGP